MEGSLSLTDLALEPDLYLLYLAKHTRMSTVQKDLDLDGRSTEYLT